MDRRPARDDRGQSYTLGYFLVLSIVLLGGVALFVTGAVVLSGSSDRQPVADGERNMIRLNEEILDVADGSPYQSLTMETSNARLSYGEPVQVRVEANLGPSSPTRSYESSTTGTIRPIVYRLEDQGVTLRSTAGLVSRRDSTSLEPVGGSDVPTAVRQAGAAFDTSATATSIVVPLTAPAAGSSSSVGSGDVSQVPVGLRRGESRTERETGVDTSGTTEIAGTVTIVDPPAPQAWASHFRESGFESVTVGDLVNTPATPTDGPDVRAEFESETLFVRFVRVDTTLGEN